MKRMSWVLLVLLVLGPSVVMANPGDVIESVTNYIVNARTDSGTGNIGGSYYKGSTLLLTNCYAIAAGGTTQGLDGVTIDISVGNTATNTDYTGRVYTVSTSTNRWWQTITIPSNVSGTMYLQVKLTDAYTNSYIYPWKMITFKDAM